MPFIIVTDSYTTGEQFSEQADAVEASLELAAVQGRPVWVVRIDRTAAPSAVVGRSMQQYVDWSDLARTYGANTIRMVDSVIGSAQKAMQQASRS